MFSKHLGTGVPISVAIDLAGNTYVAGLTADDNFITTPGAYQTTHASGMTVGFVVKLAPDGTLIYSTFLGGSTAQPPGAPTYSAVAGLVVDAAGHAFVTGSTRDADFPTTPGAAITAAAEITKGFVAELAADGASLVYSTLLGAPTPNASGVGLGTAPTGIAVDAEGTAYVAGTTDSVAFPVSPGTPPLVLQPFEVGGFLSRISPDGTRLVASTTLATIPLAGVALLPGGAVVLGGTKVGDARTYSPDVLSVIDADGVTVSADQSLLQYSPNATAFGHVQSVVTDAHGDVHATIQTIDSSGANYWLAHLDAHLAVLEKKVLPAHVTEAHVAVDGAGGTLLALNAYDVPYAPVGNTAPPSPGAGSYGCLVRLRADGVVSFSSCLANVHGTGLATGGHGRAALVGTDGPPFLYAPSLVNGYTLGD